MSTSRRSPIEGPTEFDPGTMLDPLEGEAPTTSFRVYLLVRNGDETSVVDVPDGGSVLFGRAPEAQVLVDDARASRRHAELRRSGQELLLMDLGSRNGTRLNDRKLRSESAPVTGGDVIRVGGIEAIVATAETQRGPSTSSSRLERELSRFAATPGARAILCRIVMDLELYPDGIASLTEQLGPMTVIEERGDGEYAALLEEGDSAAAERVLAPLRKRPGLQLTTARFPDQGRTAQALWAEAASKGGAELVTDAREGVVVADPAMLQVFQLAKKLAGVQTTVLILGETGVGKEVIAEQIHKWSGRAQGPFVRLNCASLPETLLESELFGHERGAFTGADRRKIGYLEAAQDGSLFLDEIGELPLAVQVRLLNVLENREVRRLGGTQAHPIDVRVISATHRDLQGEVAAGRFREDLYYRLSAFTLNVPPLRERQAEIPLLAEMFARESARRAGRAMPVLDPQAIAALVRHPWPGNVRELRNAMEHAVVLADRGRIAYEHLPDSVRRRDGAPQAAPSAAGTVKDKLADLERRSIEEALGAEHGNQTRAARRLGMSRRALIYKIEKYGLRK